MGESVCKLSLKYDNFFYVLPLNIVMIFVFFFFGLQSKYSFISFYFFVNFMY